jgi:hypothetical protein
MAGLDPAIHASPQANFTKESVGDRVKPGHDEKTGVSCVY